MKVDLRKCIVLSVLLIVTSLHIYVIYEAFLINNWEAIAQSSASAAAFFVIYTYLWERWVRRPILRIQFEDNPNFISNEICSGGTRKFIRCEVWNDGYSTARNCEGIVRVVAIDSKNTDAATAFFKRYKGPQVLHWSDIDVDLQILKQVKVSIIPGWRSRLDLVWSETNHEGACLATPRSLKDGLVINESYLNSLNSNEGTYILDVDVHPENGNPTSRTFYVKVGKEWKQLTIS